MSGKAAYLRATFPSPSGHEPVDFRHQHDSPRFAESRRGQQGTARNREGNTTMNIKPSAIVVAAVIGVAGCSSLGTSSAPASSGGSSAPPAPVAATSSAMCLTNACIVQDMDQSMVGMVAKDESVATKAKCKASTVKHNAGDTYTAKCTVTYSDGVTVTGFGNLLVAQQKITFEPDLSGN